MRNTNYQVTVFDTIGNLLIGERSFYFLSGKLMSKYNRPDSFSYQSNSESEDNIARHYNSSEKDSDIMKSKHSVCKAGIRLLSSETPGQFSLYQNYPNPFSGKTFINFHCPSLSFISIKLYDINWKEITTLVYEKLTPGTYQIELDSCIIQKDRLPEGIYFYRMDSENFTDTRKMFILNKGE